MDMYSRVSSFKTVQMLSRHFQSFLILFWSAQIYVRAIRFAIKMQKQASIKIEISIKIPSTLCSYEFWASQAITKLKLLPITAVAIHNIPHSQHMCELDKGKVHREQQIMQWNSITEACIYASSMNSTVNCERL